MLPWLVGLAAFAVAVTTVSNESVARAQAAAPPAAPGATQNSAPAPGAAQNEQLQHCHHPRRKTFWGRGRGRFTFPMEVICAS